MKKTLIKAIHDTVTEYGYELVELKEYVGMGFENHQMNRFYLHVKKCGNGVDYKHVEFRESLSINPEKFRKRMIKKLKSREV